MRTVVCGLNPHGSAHRAALALLVIFAGLSPCAAEQAEAAKRPAAPWTVARDSGWKELEPGLDLSQATLD